MNKNNIEDIYLLSPLQEGLLFHALYTPESAAYFLQLKFSLHGRLDVAAWQRAWEQVIERHPILRTSFIWTRQDKPLQVVRKRVNLPWQQQDWRGIAADEQQERLETFLGADQKQGLDLSKAPLLRMALIRMTDEDYEFIFSHHHLLVDGWSTSIIIKEVFAFYRSSTKGQELHLDRARPYRDFIDWIERHDLYETESFWRKTLRGFTTPTALSADSMVVAPLNDGERQEQQQRWLGASASAKLQSLARRHELTLNTLVLGAWAFLLSRHTGKDDVVFGVTVSGRPAQLEGVEAMVGLFINTLPLRVTLPPHEELLVWLKNLQFRLLELRDYEHSPLVQVQGWSELPRGVPLFESMLVFENYPVDFATQTIDEQLEVSSIRSIERSNFPLGAIVAPGRELFLQIGYDARLFDFDQISRMLDHFELVLEGIGSDPHRRLSELPILTDAEQRELLVTWNETDNSYPQDKCIHQLVEEQAALTPQDVALVFEHEQVTYHELNKRANQLAHYLIGLGVGPEVRVGVLMERSMEMIVGLLGILKAGAAYLPLDPGFPLERIDFMLEDAGVSVLLTQERLIGRLRSRPEHVLSLDSGSVTNTDQHEMNPLSSVVAANAAYVIYTSGSTGQPKAVIVAHREIGATLSWLRKTFSLSGADRVLQNVPFTFDPSVGQIFGALTSGARLVLARPGSQQDSRYLVEMIADQKITLTDFVPSMLQVILKEPGIEKCTSLRHILCGGEAMTRDLPEEFYARLSASLHNMYGPTEASIDATHWTCQRNDDRQIIPIGRPLDNRQAYVLDSRLQPGPVGTPGELYIGGAGLARGYLNRPELTADKFVPHPFSKKPGARLYRTGDLVRYRSDGNIEFLGRVDHQVKVRGFRIELGEVEETLTTHPAVQECVVVAREDVVGDKRLVAYLIVVSGAAVSSSELRLFLGEKLPDYMIPSAFTVIKRLPLTAHGKIDRQALPEPAEIAANAEGDSVLARGQVEELLTGIWAQALGLERVGIFDNFFALGGHSLKAARIISRVRDAFRIEIPMRALFQHPTVAGLAEVVGTELRNGQNLSLPPLERAARDGDLAMSFAQQRLWFLDRLIPDNAFYNIADAFYLKGVLQPEGLEESLNEVVKRHEVLRTTFASKDGQLVQVIAPEMQVLLPVIDLERWVESEQKAEALRLAKEEAQRPFDLECGPLLRTTLLRLDATNHVLLLTTHHIISDGWSMGLLLEELTNLYRAYSTGTVAALIELPVQYADFSVWQQQWLRGEVLEAELDYWRRQLDGAPAVLEFPTDKPRPATQSFRGATHSFELSKTLTRSLKALSRKESVTLFMTLLAAFETLLYRYTGQEDIVVGSPIAGRNGKEVEGLIGFFVNTLVLRTNLSGAPSFRNVLSRVREVTLGAYAHQDLPFEKLIEELQPERDMSRSPLFQVMFTFQNTPARALELPGVTLSTMEVESGASKFDLELLMADTGEELVGVLEYDVDLFEAETVARLAKHFQTLLESVIANPDHSLAQLSLLSDEERQQLLTEPNSIYAHYPLDQCLPQLFEAQVERTPLAVAVTSADEQVSYAELNRRANAMARSLVLNGVSRNVIVPVLAERGIEFLITIMAVFKAGGAYLPLDPRYPAKRIALVLTQSEAPLILVAGAFVPVLDQALEQMAKEHRPRIIEIEKHLRQPQEEGNLDPRCSACDLAYVIYTSGSTGMPKGAMIEHCGMLNHLYAKIADLQLTDADNVAQTAAQSFDISVWQFFAALLVGGQVHVFSDEVAFNPSRLFEEVGREKISILETVPSLLRPMLDEGERDAPTPVDLSALRWLIPTGEALPPELCRQWLNRYPDVPMLNAYGPTECSDDVSHYQIYEPPVQDAYRTPIGRPVANMHLYIVDNQIEPVPIGVRGELLVGGVGVGRGYLNDARRTAEVFIPDPFAQQPGARLYRTGDLARYLPDRNIEFLGRLDHQVKVRGFRIELGEIEAVLDQHPALQEAVVIDREDITLDVRLVAYVVPNQEPSPSPSDLRNFLKEKLPEYMVPSSFVFLDKLPLTSNGKLDRRALPPPDTSLNYTEDSYLAPRNDIEIRLVRIWEEMLQVSNIGIADNFFDLGGHSILALRLMGEIQRQFGRVLPLAILFEKSTIKHLAGVLRQQFNALPLSPMVPIQPGGSRTPLFFVHVGSGQVLCYLDLARNLGPDQPFYGLQDPYLHAEGAFEVPIEEMAAQYIEAIRLVQPEGPYLMGGWSFGGLVAFEMALQLRERGEEVGLLALLDTGAPDWVRNLPNPTDDALLLGIIARELNLRVLDSELQPLEPDEQLRYVAELMRDAHLIFENPVAYLKREVNIFKARTRVIQNYIPKIYPEQITFFRASIEDDGSQLGHPSSESEPDPTRGFTALSTKPIEVYEVPGTHHQIAREPNVRVLAEQLRDCIDRALEMQFALCPVRE